MGAHERRRFYQCGLSKFGDHDVHTRNNAGGDAVPGRFPLHSHTRGPDGDRGRNRHLRAHLIVPAAQAFCLAQEHVLCSPAGETDAPLTPKRAAFLNAVALLAAEGFTDDASDDWRMSGPDTEGDCEDKALWAAGVIARRDPALKASMAAVAFRDGANAHVALAVFTERGVLLIDGFNYVPRLMARADLATKSGYPGRVYIASSGVGHEWIPWN